MMEYLFKLAGKLAVGLLILWLAVSWLGPASVSAIGSNTGSALVNATGGLQPGHGLPSQVAVPRCKYGWSDTVPVPVGKANRYDANVTLVVQKQWAGRWTIVQPGDYGPSQAIRFCTNDPFKDPIATLEWTNI